MGFYCICVTITTWLFLAKCDVWMSTEELMILQQKPPIPSSTPSRMDTLSPPDRKGDFSNSTFTWTQTRVKLSKNHCHHRQMLMITLLG